MLTFSDGSYHLTRRLKAITECGGERILVSRPSVMLREANLTLSSDGLEWQYFFSPDVYPGNLLDVFESTVPRYCNMSAYFIYDDVQLKT